jgi:spore maturation protein CgeB
VRIVMFYHSLLSDWNHGNAHFLRGIVTELIFRGHQVRVYEPFDSWSRSHLDREPESLARFHEYYPNLHSTLYDPASLDLELALDDVDLVIVHEWNDADFMRRIGKHRARHNGYKLLFHDTHHRSTSDATSIAKFDLKYFDGVLAFGRVIRDLYLDQGWSRNAWTWHEAADVRIFKPLAEPIDRDLVWIGNWGDGERTAELHEFLIEPVRALGLKATVYGVRYPDKARAALASAGIEYRGWLPNYLVPEVFANHRVTIHIPRRPYVRSLPGIPTIRVFEALACGIPLISAPWKDAERLFRAGKDFVIANDGEEMRSCLEQLLNDESIRQKLAVNGRQTVLARHTCAHRVDELMNIHQQLLVTSDTARQRLMAT